MAIKKKFEVKVAPVKTPPLPDVYLTCPDGGKIRYSFEDEGFTYTYADGNTEPLEFDCWANVDDGVAQVQDFLSGLTEVFKKTAAAAKRS